MLSANAMISFKKRIQTRTPSILSASIIILPFKTKSEQVPVDIKDDTGGWSVGNCGSGSRAGEGGEEQRTKEGEEERAVVHLVGLAGKGMSRVGC